MLVLCSACSRHVKIMPCPFCGGSNATATRPQPVSRLSRAQLLAGAALVSVAAGCSSDETPTPDPGDDDDTTSSSGSAQPVYGAPVADAGDDGGSSGLAPAYGSPADGGFTTSSSGASPAYGAPPGDSGTL